MSLRSHIVDAGRNIKAHLLMGSEHDNTDEKNALVVATRSAKQFENRVVFFTNEENGADLNIGVQFGVNPEVIYADDAGPPAEWTTTTVIGNAGDFDTDDDGTFCGGTQAGVACVQASASENNDTLQFARGSSINLSNYRAVTGYCALTSILLRDGTKAIEFFGWNTETASQVGSIVDIGDYIDENSLADVGAPNWQRFTIPLSDMDLTSQNIDAFRVRTVDTGGGGPPNYYLDTIQIEQRGNVDPAIYRITANKETWLHVLGFSIFIADNDFDSTATDNSLPAIPYDSILGVSALANGVVYQRIQDKVVRETFVIRQFSDLIRLPSVSVVSSGSATDGSDTWIKVDIVFAEPLVLKWENDDELRFDVSDNLAGLDEFNIAAHAKEELRR